MSQTPPSIDAPQKCIAVLWPSFLLAIAASGLFFSAFPPAELRPFGEELMISDLGIYTIGFFLFWMLTTAAGVGTLYFTISNCRIKHQHQPAARRSA